MHSHLAARNHQRISHVITGISHISQTDSFQMSKLLLNGKKVSKHLGRMIFIRQTVPNRHTGILCQFFNNFLSKATVLNTVKHTSKHACRIRNTFFLANLGTLRVKVGHAHA